jgi:hypothetical protein
MRKTYWKTGKITEGERTKGMVERKRKLRVPRI